MSDIPDYKKHIKGLVSDFRSLRYTPHPLITDNLTRYLMIYRDNGQLFLEGMKLDYQFVYSVKFYNNAGNLIRIENYYFNNEGEIAGCLVVDDKVLFCGNGNIKFGIWSYYRKDGSLKKEKEYRYIPTKTSDIDDMWIYDYKKIKTRHKRP